MHTSIIIPSCDLISIFGIPVCEYCYCNRKSSQFELMYFFKSVYPENEVVSMGSGEATGGEGTGIKKTGEWCRNRDGKQGCRKKKQDNRIGKGTESSKW